MRCFMYLVALLAFTGVSRGDDIVIATVPVGDTHNRDDTHGPTYFGYVHEAYRIGKTEVTNSEYAYFLNSVAAVGTSTICTTGTWAGRGMAASAVSSAPAGEPIASLFCTRY